MTVLRFPPILVALSLPIVLSAPLQRISAQSPRDTVRALFEARMRELGIPGAQLAVIRDGRLLLTVNYGQADIAGRVPVTDTTRFRVGSLSKLFTAAAAARLWSQHRLDIDAPATTLVPEFVAGTSGVTARRLAGHIGGVRHYVGKDFTRPPQRFPTVIDALVLFATDSLVNAPGTRYLYSSFGYNLLGAMVERAAKEDFRRYVETTLITPLGLTRTMYERADSAIAGVTDGFDPDSGGRWRLGNRSDLSDRWPSGGMMSTAIDLARMADASVRGSFFSPAERALFFTSMKRDDGAETGVGFGWRIGKDSAENVIYHHGGAVQGGRAMLMTWRDHPIAVAITTNLTAQGRQVTERDAMAIGKLVLR